MLLLKSNSKALSCVKSPFLSLTLSLSLSFILSLCLICSSGHDVHQPLQPACSSKKTKKTKKKQKKNTEMFTKIIVTYFHGHFLMLNIPVSGKNTPVTAVVPQRHVEWVTTPTWLSTKYCACSSAPVSHSVIWMRAPPICIHSQHNGTLFFFPFFLFRRVTLRLGGNWRPTVRHILRGVSFIGLLICAISKLPMSVQIVFCVTLVLPLRCMYSTNGFHRKDRAARVHIKLLSVH